MSLKKTPIHCPICKTIVASESEAFPFCSPRCQTIDLGNWASDAYSINDNTSEDDAFEQNDGVHQENRTIH